MAATGELAGAPSGPVVIRTNAGKGMVFVPALIFVGLLVSVVSSLGAPLVPTIATDYGVSLGSAQWSLTITLLVGAVTSPVVGRLGDGPRRRTVLLVVLGLLVTGSVSAALPLTAFALLLFGRALQGVGLALLPLVMSVARDHLEADRSRTALATLSVTSVVGIGLGYPISGVIAERLSLHAGFWIAAALGLVAMALALWLVPPSTHQVAQPFDGPGAVFLGLGLAGLLLSISEASEWGWGSTELLSVALASLAVLAAWVWHELRTSDALVDLHLMANRDVLTANATGILGGIGMYMMLSMAVRYVQTPTSVSYGLGASVVVAGLTLVPLSVASYLASKLAVRLSRWIGPARVLPIGALAVAAAMTLFAVLRSQLWEVLLAMAICGAGMGLLFAVMPRMIVTAVRATETSSALSLNQVLRTIGYSMGSALAATVLAAHTVAGQEFPTSSGYTVGALIGVGLSLTTAAVSAILPARRAVGPPLDRDSELLIEEDVDAAIVGAVAISPDDNRRRFEE